MRALEQELALAQQDGAWVRDELSREQTANARARSELHARVTHAEAELDLAHKARAAASAQLARTEELLRDTQHRLTEAAAELADERAAAAAREHEAALERRAAAQAAELADARVARAEARAAELEAHCDALVA